MASKGFLGKDFDSSITTVRLAEKKERGLFWAKLGRTTFKSKQAKELLTKPIK